MDPYRVKLFWLQIPLTFPGVPNVLRVQLKRPGGPWACCCLARRRRYRTSLRVGLEARQWQREGRRLTHYFAPPLLFPVLSEGFRLKVTLEDLATRASRTYKISKKCRDFGRHLPDICLVILPEENVYSSEQGPASPSEAYSSALEVREVSQDGPGLSKGSISHPEEPSCGREDCVVNEENPGLSDGVLSLSTPDNASEGLVNILVSPSSSKESPRRRAFGEERSRVPFPSTKQILDCVQTSQERITFPDFPTDPKHLSRDVLQSVFQWQHDRLRMFSKMNYNANIYCVHLKRRVLGMINSFAFGVSTIQFIIRQKMQDFREGLRSRSAMQQYSGVAESATYGHDDVRTQMKLEQRILRLIRQLKFTHDQRMLNLTKAVRNNKKLMKQRLRAIKFRMASGHGALLAFVLTHVGRTLFWLLATMVLTGLYLYINYRAAGEVKNEVLVFVTHMIAIFSMCSNFRLGRVYIMITTLQIAVKFTSKTHLLFIFTEMIRLQLTLVENMRRVGQATICYRNLYKNIVENLIEREKEKRAERLALILEHISDMRERLAQALRSVFLFAQYVRRTIERIKGNFKSIGLLLLICNTVVPMFENYCGASVGAVRRDCEAKVGFLKHLGACHIVEWIRQGVCALVYHPFNFMCNFDDIVKKFLNEALEDSGLKEMYQQLKQEFTIEVDVEYRFNHTIHAGGSSDKKDMSEVFDQLASYLPGLGAGDFLFLLLYYVFMVMAFVKPLLDITHFKKSLSYCNDCTDSKTFKRLDCKEPEHKRILPLKKDDKMDFRAHIFSLPGKSSKRFLLLLSAYWPSAVAIFLSLITTFFTALMSIDLSFVSFLDLTALNPDSKDQLKEARKAAKNYTVPGIFTKSAKDFYRKMNQFQHDHAERAKTFRNYEKKHKSCAPEMLTPDIQLLKKFYIWTWIIFVCNTFGLVLRLTEGKLLEHFFPDYKVPRALDLMERVKEQRAIRAEQIRQAEKQAKMAAALMGAEEQGLKKKKKKKKKKSKPDAQETDADQPDTDEPAAGNVDADEGDGDSVATATMAEKLLSLVRRLLPKTQLFFLEKFVCTVCGKTTPYRSLQECVQPSCGELLCNSCVHLCQVKYEGKCSHCGGNFFLDTQLEFSLQPSPTRSLCEEDLEPAHVDPKVRFRWMKPLTLCTQCGEHFVLNYLLERCVLCRKGGIRGFNPQNYEAPIRKAGEDSIRIHMPGFEVLASDDSAADSASDDDGLLEHD